MASVAVAALLAATGVATAQGVNQGGAKGSESPASVSPKAETTAPMNAPAAKGVPNAASHGSPTEATPQHAQSAPDAKHAGDAKADGKPKARRLWPRRPPEGHENSGRRDEADRREQDDRRDEGGRDDQADRLDHHIEGPEDPDRREQAFGARGQDDRQCRDHGNCGASAEKRTQITSAIKQEKVEEVTNVNFNISIGTAVPAGVRYHALPSRIVEIYPEWRGYEFVLVHGRYVILRPHTHEIVYIIEG